MQSYLPFPKSKKPWTQIIPNPKLKFLFRNPRSLHVGFMTRIQQFKKGWGGGSLQDCAQREERVQDEASLPLQNHPPFQLNHALMNCIRMTFMTTHLGVTKRFSNVHCSYLCSSSTSTLWESVRPYL